MTKYLTAPAEARVDPLDAAPEDGVSSGSAQPDVGVLDVAPPRAKMVRPVNAALDVDLHPAGAIGWISLAALALVLGRTNARAARDWCNRHEVPYRRDGKHGFARVEDVRRALDALPTREDSAEQAKVRAAAARAAAAIMAGRKR